MRPGFLIFILVVMLAILAIFFWPRQRQQSVNTEPAQQLAQLTNAPTGNAGIAQNVPSVAQPTISQATNSIQNDRDKLPELFQKYNEQHNLPIEFYGLVIDQDTNPLSGVKIDAAISQTYMESPTNLAFTPKTFHLKKETGTDGRFEITGETGEGVNIEYIQKAGYELEPTKRHYDSFSGSIENPVVFKMWSTNIHEQLITGERKFQIVPDGRAYFINLTDGTISESGIGDLKVWVKFPTEVTSSQIYDWSSEIDPIDGGLLEETNLNSAMYSAPADGYIPQFPFDQEIKEGQSGSTGSHRFYIRLKNGQEYGRITIELYAPYNNQIPGLIRMSYAINPSGSHILR